MSVKKLQEYALKAKPVFFGKEVKGFILEVDDFMTLLGEINELNEQDEKDE